MPHEDAARSNVTAAPAVSSTILGWQDDPGSGRLPTGGLVLPRPVPQTNRAPFPTIIVTSSAPPPDRYSLGTSSFRYWAAADALRRVGDFWGSILPSTTPWNPAVGGSLRVLLDQGADFNAYYDRSALNFFHGSIAGRTVYSAESPDVVCHEFGHAVLDAIRPQLWGAAAFEAGAFHESFGDMSAILSALQLPEVRAAVLSETSGNLKRSSRLSRLAEQLGWAIRQQAPDAVDPDCLRNAVNSFSYVSPRRLPPNAPAGSLSREVHSFSRVFTGAFFEALAGMFATHPTQTEVDLQAVASDMGRYLVQAIGAASVVSSYFAQVGSRLVKAASADNAAYGAAIRAAFVRRGLVSVRGAVALTAEPDDRGFEAFTAAPSTELPTAEIDTSEYGLTVPSIKVQTAGEPVAFDVRSMSFAGDAKEDDPDAEAASFLEDLISQGQLDMGVFGDQSRALIAMPTTIKTHYLEQVGEQAVLRRALFDCFGH